MNAPTISGIHHVTINVRDVETSERWYADVLGFERVVAYDTGTFHRVIVRHVESGLHLGLNRHDDPAADERFDERRTGLDHIALEVPSRGDLDTWIERFDEHGVEHSDVKPAAVPGSFLIAFRDPDNVQFEMFSPVKDTGASR